LQISDLRLKILKFGSLEILTTRSPETLTHVEESTLQTPICNLKSSICNLAITR